MAISSSPGPGPKPHMYSPRHHNDTVRSENVDDFHPAYSRSATHSIDPIQGKGKQQQIIGDSKELKKMGKDSSTIGGGPMYPWMKGLAIGKSHNLVLVCAPYNYAQCGCERRPILLLAMSGAPYA